MNLTTHQKEIVKKIVDGQIYDIASYLISTNNYRVEKYDIDRIKSKFKTSENGKKYKVASSFDSIFVKSTNSFGFPSVLPKNKITEDDYTMKEAVLVDNAPAIHYEFEGVKYDLDFVKGVKVVNDYELLIDFLTLWHYLKEEALILELDKKLETQDVGFFFEPKEIDESTPKAKIVIEKEGKTYSPVESALDDILLVDPQRFLNEYSDITWKINEERLLMCKEFLTKKFVPTTALRTYAKKKFKTKETISNDINRLIAIFALAVSVISVILGNIIPLFQTKTTEDYLQTINQELISIQSTLNDNEEQIEEELSSIRSAIEELQQQVATIDDKTSISQLEDIKQQLSEIKQAISDISVTPSN